MTRNPIIRAYLGKRGKVVDNFAGGGGVSEAFERALGRSPDHAINHDPEALTMHAVPQAA
jgi:DNA (cytosine-5)-methyltransferase 1